MILTYEDDGCIHLYSSLEAVVVSIEALDADACLRHVFDDTGRRYLIEWIRPNNDGGWLRGLENGEYRLVPSGQPDPTALHALLAEAGDTGLTDQERAHVEELRSRLLQRAKGAR